MVKDIRKKRLFREFNTIKEKYCAFYDNEKMEIHVYLNLYGMNKKLVFKYHKYYPFKVPYLYVNNKNYINNLCVKHAYIKYILKKENISCLCCKSLFCSWVASIKTISLIEEYKQNFDLFMKGFYYDMLIKAFQKINIDAKELVEKILFYV